MNATMRAATLYGDDLRIEHVPVPRPAAGQLLVKVSHCGICGSDLHAPKYGLADGFVLGHEIVGEIVEIGAGVATPRVGEHVTVLPILGCGQCGPCRSGLPARCKTGGHIGTGVPGGFAEYVVTADLQTFRLPNELRGAQATLVEPMAIGLHLVRRSRIDPMDRVLVIGAGPVGQAIVAWLRHFGVRSVWASDPLPRRRALAIEGGADGAIDPVTEDVVRTFRAGAGARPDVIFDCAGARLMDAIEYANVDARIVSAAYHHQPVSVDVRWGMAKEIDLLFASWYTSAEFTHTLDQVHRGLVAVDHLITDVRPLEALPATFHELHGPNDQGKVVIAI